MKASRISVSEVSDHRRASAKSQSLRWSAIANVGRRGGAKSSRRICDSYQDNSGLWRSLCIELVEQGCLTSILG